MSQDLELALRAKNETDAAFAALKQNVEQLKGGVGGLGEQMGATTASAVAMGVGIGATVEAFNKISEEVGRLIEEFVSFGHSLDLIHEKLNVPLETAAAWQQSASVTGMSAEAITNALAMMDTRLATGNKQAAQALRDLGISITEIQAASPERQVEMLAQAFQALEANGGKADVVIKELMGRGGLGLLPFLTKDAQDLIRELEHINGPLDEQVKAAKEYENQWALLAAHADAFKRALTAPIVGGLAQWMEDINKHGFYLPGIWGQASAEHNTPGGWPTGGDTFLPPALPPHWEDRKETPYEKAAERAGAAWKKFHEEMQLRSFKTTEAMEHDVDKAVKHIADARTKEFEHELGLAAKIDSENEAFAKKQDARTEQETQDYIAAGNKRDKEAEDDARNELARNQQLVAAQRQLADSLLSIGAASHGAFGVLATLAGGAIGTIANLDDKALRATGTWQKLANAMQGAIQAFQSGSVLAGAAAGAMAGAQWGVVGAAIGAVGGAILGLFGHAKKAREELAKLHDQLLKTFGTFENFQHMASAAGAGFMVQIMMGTKDPATFKSWLDAINKAIEDQKQRIEGLKTATEGLNLAATGWAAALEKGVDEVRIGDKIDALGHHFKRFKEILTDPNGAQAAFDRLGREAFAVFGAIVRETGDVVAALRQIGPTLDVLAREMEKWGFTASGAVQELLGLRAVIENNKELMDQISGLNLLTKGLAQAGLNNKEIWNDFGKDAVADFNALTEKTGNATQAMILMQPALQQLWEHQQKFHDITDEATLALLDQAAKQGLVGEDMKSVFERIYDAVRDLADAIRGLPSKKDFTFNVHVNDPDNLLGGEPPEPPSHGPKPHAMGGWFPYRPGGYPVTVGEAGNEAVLNEQQIKLLVSEAAKNGGSQPGGRGEFVIHNHIHLGSQELVDWFNRQKTAGYIH